jgi:ATP-dependent helicase/nuclease subunit B
VDIVTKQIALGEFDVGYVEKRFKKENSIMSLNGVIDRLDIAKKNGKSYVRVIDYKTGKTEFDMELLKAGLQLQLAVYTTEAIAMFKEQGEDIQPAGMYYYRIDDPIIDAGADVEKERMKDLRLDGLTVDEDDIIGLHDSSLVDKDGNRLAEKSEVIKYEYTKEGHISKNSEKCVIPKDDFENIGRTADRLAGELAKGILEGNVAVNPYQHNNFTPCTYCPYINVCGFDRKRGDKYRNI